MLTWHFFLSGFYDSEEDKMGVDYQRLISDPVVAQIVYYHELTHFSLFKTTEFGLATQTIIQTIMGMKHLSLNDKERVKIELAKSQKFVQEGTASLVEMLGMKSMKGKTFAKNWAQRYMPPDYLERYKKLEFVLDMSKGYSESFTKNIPHQAMHNQFRKLVYEQDLLRKPDKLIEVLNNPQINPNERYAALISKIYANPGIVVKDIHEILKLAGVEDHPSTSKQDIANFLNYVNELCGQPFRFKEEDILDLPDNTHLYTGVTDEALVANLNLNIAENGIFLPKKEDLLLYKKEIEAIMILRVEDLESSKKMEELTGQKYEFALICFLRTGEKYLFVRDKEIIKSLINEEFKDKTLITKWGLFDPTIDEILYFPGSRLPDVVIYNSVSNIEPILEDMAKSKKIDYLYGQAMEDSPIHSLFFKDSKGTLHLVNTYGNRSILKLLEKYPNFFNKSNKSDFLSNFDHYNNAICVWNGFDWRVDWYSSALTNTLKLRS